MGLADKQHDDFVFGLKYRPRTIDDIVLPPRFKKLFNEMVETKNIGSILLAGPQGCGKTTAAFCLADQTGLDTKYMRMSKDTSIDHIRGQFMDFVSTVSMTDGKKLFIGDEFDRISPQAMDSLKTELEVFTKNCNFIFITNHKNVITPELLSRLDEIDFVFKQSEKTDMKKALALSIVKILRAEDIKFEKDAIKTIINKNFPDMRKIINVVNLVARQNGGVVTLDGVNDNFVTNVELVNFYRLLAEKDYGQIRTLISSLSIDLNTFYSTIFSTMGSFIKDESVAEAVMILDEYQHKSVFAVDAQIPLSACCIRLMTECEWESKNV